MIRIRAGGALRKGFTLVEILIALSIFVGAAAVLSRLILLGLDNADYSQRQAEGLLLAESRFAELDAGILTAAQIDGQTESTFPGWVWGMDVAAAGNYLSKVTVTVRRTSQGVDQGVRVTLTRLFFDAVAAAAANTSSSSSSSSSSTSSSGASSTAGGS